MYYYIKRSKIMYYKITYYYNDGQFKGRNRGPIIHLKSN